MVAVADVWKNAYSLLEPGRPPSDFSLYVRPEKSCATYVMDELNIAPAQPHKFLLVGSRGGGKSTELRAIMHHLEEKKVRVASIDLDASGFTPSSLSAFDLLYLCGVALLRFVPESLQKEQFDKLAKAYGINDEQVHLLGSYQEALAGLASFVERGGQALTAGGVDTAAGAPGLGIVGGSAVGTQIRILARDLATVAENSPSGQGLLAACTAIYRLACHDKGDVWVLVDGLEKMNGEAGERFKQIFEYTRLLSNPPWNAVYAAPPCTLTQTTSADNEGYKVLTVWGFVNNETALVKLLRTRFEVAKLQIGKHISEPFLIHLAQASGGLPRRAIELARQTVREAWLQQSEQIQEEHLKSAQDKVTEDLTRGLTSLDYDLLVKVKQSKLLPDNERVASLFADGRILAVPAKPRTQFMIAPLLEEAVLEHEKAAPSQ